MDNPEINGVELEELIFKAAHYERQALDTLLYCEFMTRLFKRLAQWAWRRYNVDGEEVRDYVFDRIQSQSRSPHKGPRKPWLKNPHRSSWRSCLAKWAYTVARNRCLNILRHYEVGSRHAASIEHKHTTRIEHGTRIVGPSAHTPSPEKELERKEQEEKIHEKAWQVFDSSTEECQRIASLWASGMTLEQIVAKLGTSIETVRRKLKKFQKAFVEEVSKGIAEEIGEAKTEENGVRCVLEEIVTNREDLGDLLPRGALTAPTAAPPAESAPGPEPGAPRPHGPRKRRRRRTPSIARAA